MEENVQTVAPSTRSVGVKYGLMSAIVSIILFLILAVLGKNPYQGPMSWVGIVISIGLMFLAQKNFKDSGNGFMSYGQGVAIGFWFTLVGVALSIAVNYIYINFVDHAPMDIFLEEQAEQMSSSGQSDQAIEVAQEWTKKLFWVFGIVGAMFWGMLMALILTIFTQRKAPEQTF